MDSRIWKNQALCLADFLDNQECLKLSAGGLRHPGNEYLGILWPCMYKSTDQSSQLSILLNDGSGQATGLSQHLIQIIKLIGDK